jgi:2'-5' RNA ligase
MTTTWRVFCAVELPDEVRAQLHEHIADLRAQVPDAAATWSRVDNIHLTLKFFGNLSIDQVPKISAAATRVVEEFRQFKIAVGGTGVFPRPSRAQVLWIGVGDPSGKLADLQKRFEDECANEGFEKEDRAYRPHLTIARLRKPSKRLAETHLQMKFKTADLTLRELIVFRSELSPKGSRYTDLSRHSLRNP